MGLWRFVVEEEIVVIFWADFLRRWWGGIAVT